MKPNFTASNKANKKKCNQLLNTNLVQYLWIVNHFPITVLNLIDYITLPFRAWFSLVTVLTISASESLSFCRLAPRKTLFFIPNYIFQYVTPLNRNYEAKWIFFCTENWHIIFLKPLQLWKITNIKLYRWIIQFSLFFISYNSPSQYKMNFIFLLCRALSMKK